MAPNKKTKKTPRRRAPRTTNQNKATASNKTSVRVTVNAPAPRRRRAANPGQSATQPRGPQFVFLPAAQPAAQPQVIQQMPMKDLFEMMRELKNPPPPTAAEIRDEPRRRNLLRPEDIFYHRRDAGFTDEPPMFVGGRMSDNVSPFDDDLSTTVKSTVRNPVRLETPNTFSGIQNFDWAKGDQMTESRIKKPNSFTPGFDPDDIATTSAFFTPINPIPKGTLLNQNDIFEKYRAEQSGRQDVVKPVSSTPVVQAIVDPIEVFPANTPEPMRDEEPARPKNDLSGTPGPISKPRTDYVSKLRRGTIKTPKPDRLRVYGIQIMEINGIPSYYDTIKDEPIGPVIG